MIYFMQPIGGGPIKIGYSAAPNDRLADLECGYGQKLRLLATTSGGPGRERALHDRFARYRSKRVRSTACATEWYEPSEELARLVEKHGGVVDGPLAPHKPEYPHICDGARLLRDWLGDCDITRSDAARQIGGSVFGIDDLVHGRGMPCQFTAEIIAQWTHGEVPLDAWLVTDGHRTCERLPSDRGIGSREKTRVEQMRLLRERLSRHAVDFDLAQDEAA
jgi:hypothetical protein